MNKPEELLNEYYLENNFEIINFNNSKNRKKRCYVFFSSNGLYKDRNDIDIIKKMHDTGRYEWKYIASNKKIINNANKIIFIRDIYKIFYIRGINIRINSIEKIKELLQKETSGMDVILAGSSAGAYMALLFGKLLSNTVRVLSLGGVVDLNSFRSFSSYLDDNIDKCDYIDITDKLFGDYWIINFYGAKNSYDSLNAKLIELHSNSEKLINVGFDIDFHAPRPSGDDIIKLLICKENFLKRLKRQIGLKKTVSQSYFSIRNIGLFKYIFNETKKFIVILLKRGVHEKKN